MIGIAESEGHATRLKIDITNGRATVSPTDATPTFECSDRVWAAIATGDLPATRALRYSLAAGESSAAAILDALCLGPAPFCHEYF